MIFLLYITLSFFNVHAEFQTEMIKSNVVIEQEQESTSKDSGPKNTENTGQNAPSIPTIPMNENPYIAIPLMLVFVFFTLSSGCSIYMVMFEIKENIPSYLVPFGAFIMLADWILFEARYTNSKKRKAILITGVSIQFIVDLITLQGLKSTKENLKDLTKFWDNSDWYKN